MSKVSVKCTFCGKSVLIWPSQKKTHNFCKGKTRDCYQLFRVEQANKNRDAIAQSPKFPKLPSDLNHNKPKLTSNQIEEGKSLLAEGNSERFVANHLGISRHVMRMSCKPGYREWYTERFKTKEYTSRFVRNKESDREALQKRRKLIKTIAPDKYKQYVKKHNDYNRDLIRKNLFKKGGGKYVKVLAYVKPKGANHG